MKLRWLLVFFPIALALEWFHFDSLLVFAASALAVIPLAGLMGDATEALAASLGPTLGGLLNATLGNAPEIIISIFALRRGLISMVKSSLTGSIIGNLLFGLGLSMFAGGISVKKQSFDPNLARINGALLILASIGLIIPSLYRSGPAAAGQIAARHISLEIAVILFVVYLGSLIFMLATHKALLGKAGVAAEKKEAGRRLPKSELSRSSGAARKHWRFSRRSPLVWRS